MSKLDGMGLLKDVTDANGPQKNEHGRFLAKMDFVSRYGRHPSNTELRDHIGRITKGHTFPLSSVVSTSENGRQYKFVHETFNCDYEEGPEYSSSSSSSSEEFTATSSFSGSLSSSLSSESDLSYTTGTNSTASSTIKYFSNNPFNRLDELLEN